MSNVKVGRNDLCPCGSGAKYKHCCLGDVDWERIIRTERYSIPNYLSIRGKNIHFINKLGELLKLETLTQTPEWSDIKRAVDSGVVEELNEFLAELWPNGKDLKRALEKEQDQVMGLYTGNYSPDHILKGITRHSLYSDSILLINPFRVHSSFNKEFDPVIHPEKVVSATAKYIRLWLSLVPWVDAGIIKITQTPAEFEPGLFMRSYEKMEQRLEENEELRQVLDEQVEAMASSEMAKNMEEFFLISHTNEELESIYREIKPSATREELNTLIEYADKLRRLHPYYTGANEEEIIFETSGTNYEIALITSRLSGAHLITDNPFNWQIIERDRASYGVSSKQWEPFAKSFQNTDVQFLNEVPLDVALKLRKEKRLEDMRSFLRKIWRESASDDLFKHENAYHFADELQHQIRIAEDEWGKIRQDIVKMAGIELAGITAGMPTAIATGTAEWFAAGTIGTGLIGLGYNWLQRSNYKKRYPAGFFLDLKE